MYGYFVFLFWKKVIWFNLVTLLTPWPYCLMWALVTFLFVVCFSFCFLSSHSLGIRSVINSYNYLFLVLILFCWYCNLFSFISLCINFSLCLTNPFQSSDFINLIFSWLIKVSILVLFKYTISILLLTLWNCFLILENRIFSK